MGVINETIEVVGAVPESMLLENILLNQGEKRSIYNSIAYKCVVVYSNGR